MKKVLVFEDEPYIVELLVIVLTDEGFKVAGMHDAWRFEQKIIETRPDLVLLDLNLGGYDGQMICEYIKKDKDLKHIPVILMSANRDIEQVKKMCGADDLIEKPFELTTLIQKVGAYLNC